eukprot:75524_1
MGNTTSGNVSHHENESIEHKSVEEDKCDQEVVIDGKCDQRKEIIYNSLNARDKIIHCIGRLELHYQDMKENIDETSCGTGTVIKVNKKQKMCYILTAAHNCRQPIRECISCHQKTVIRKECKKCHKNTTLVEPIQWISPTKQSSIRFVTYLKSTNEINIKQFQIQGWYIRESLYSLYYKCKQGYDIAIMMFQCNEYDRLEMYSTICDNIFLQTDATFGGKDNTLFICGYPAEKDSTKMYGMPGKGNHFHTKQDSKSKKLYIVNDVIDTSGGQSGALIWSYGDINKPYLTNTNEQFFVYGIHTGGRPAKTDNGQLGQNYGTFLDVDHIKWVHEITEMLAIKACMTFEQKEMFEKTLQRQKKDYEKVLSILLKKDPWDLNSIKNHRIIVDENKIAIQGGCDTIFLSEIIWEGKYEWKFKIITHKKNAAIYIGIWKDRCGRKISDHCRHGFLGEKANSAYVFDGCKARLNIHDKDKGWNEPETFCAALNANDEISMRINFSEQDSPTLSYAINDEEYVKAFDIEKCKYRGAVSLFGNSDKIQLLSCGSCV